LIFNLYENTNAECITSGILRGLTDISEENLNDQARAIRKNEWLSKVELEIIQRSILK